MMRPFPKILDEDSGRIRLSWASTSSSSPRTQPEQCRSRWNSATPPSVGPAVHTTREDELVTDLEAVLAKHHRIEPFALAFSGAIGRGPGGTFTFSTSGSCQSSDELLAYLSEPQDFEHAIAIAALFSQPEVMEFVRALICERRPNALGGSSAAKLVALGILEPHQDGRLRLTDRGFTLFLVLYSNARACRLLDARGRP